MTGIPYTWEEGAIILAVACTALLLVVAAISYWRRLGLARDFFIGIVKGGAQLFIMAIVLVFLFGYEMWYLLIWAILLMMVVVGGYTSARRAGGMKDGFNVTMPSILAGAGASLVVMAASRAMPLEPQFIIPLAGMAFGNAMAICSLSLERIVREAKTGKAQVETALSLGATSKQAMDNLERMTVRASLIPTIDRIKTLGLIFIPGAMSGLIMAGTDPLLAAEYQMIVFAMIVTGGLVTAVLTTSLARARMFTASEQLEEWL